MPISRARTRKTEAKDGRAILVHVSDKRGDRRGERSAAERGEEGQSGHAVESRQDAAGGHRLTGKQEEVLRLVAEGLPNRLVARRLDITEKTVKAHLTQIYATLGVTDRVQAALWAQEHLR